MNDRIHYFPFYRLDAAAPFFEPNPSRFAPAEPDASPQSQERIPILPRTPIGQTSPQNAEMLQRKSLHSGQPDTSLSPTPDTFRMEGGRTLVFQVERPPRFFQQGAPTDVLALNLNETLDAFGGPEPDPVEPSSDGVLMNTFSLAVNIAMIVGTDIFLDRVFDLPQQVRHVVEVPSIPAEMYGFYRFLRFANLAPAMTPKHIGALICELPSFALIAAGLHVTMQHALPEQSEVYGHVSRDRLIDLVPPVGALIITQAMKLFPFTNRLLYQPAILPQRALSFLYRKGLEQFAMRFPSLSAQLAAMLKAGLSDVLSSVAGFFVLLHIFDGEIWEPLMRHSNSFSATRHLKYIGQQGALDEMNSGSRGFAALQWVLGRNTLMPIYYQVHAALSPDAADLYEQLGLRAIRQYNDNVLRDADNMRNSLYEIVNNSLVRNQNDTISAIDWSEANYRIRRHIRCDISTFENTLNRFHRIRNARLERENDNVFLPWMDRSERRRIAAEVTSTETLELLTTFFDDRGRPHEEDHTTLSRLVRINLMEEIGLLEEMKTRLSSERFYELSHPLLTDRLSHDDRIILQAFLDHLKFQNNGQLPTTITRAQISSRLRDLRALDGLLTDRP